MNFVLAILAGAIQGLTEFLPVSSTGHLIIFENITNISQDQFGLTFDVALHLGTLLAIILFFYKDYLSVFSLSNNLLRNIVIGTIPAVIIGILLEGHIETTFRNNWVVATALIAFSIVIFLAEKISKKKNDADSISLKQSLLIGLFQALALVPGISRSGSTISAGLMLNLKREEAARFSFLLSGPIIAGAGFKKIIDLLAAGSDNLINYNFFVIGTFSSALVGYITIKFFLKYLTTKSLYPFIAYRVILGLVILATIFYLN